VDALRCAVGFLTRLPVGSHVASDATLARSLVFFPGVGALLGAVAWALGTLLAPSLPAPLLALLITAAWALATGALHLDGVSDVFDGLGGGRGDRRRTLEIMRDSRIGAHGAVALCLVLAAKVAAMAYLLTAGSLWALWAAPMASRWAAVPLVVFWPSARLDGLGRAFNGAARPWHFLAASALAAAGLAAVGVASVAAAGAAAVSALGLAVWMHRRLGGLTGDVYGAAIELAEAAFLVAATWGGA
jgi:adenosylcobinamide-GDP ribazoletransferase